MPAASSPMVFVDLETTGATGTADRITEIGIVEVNEEGEVREWSSLVNPGVSIPPFIQSLTGITNEMVAGAPRFDELADEVLARLHGRLFVAHNARFDYGFLKNEFKRIGIDFKATVLCTVKLSRRLFPEYSKHSLDALIDRHGLHVPARHRALADASVLWQFWQKMQARLGTDALHEAVNALTGRSSWPVQLDAAVLEALPESHGVYVFYGENELPLYIGKANNVRQRVLSHFSADHRSAKEMSLSQQVRRIEWFDTPGELGALLKEAQLIRQCAPIHNRRSRRNDELCTWLLVPTQRNDDAGWMPQLVRTSELDWRGPLHAHGLFKSQREATQTLREIAETSRLCLVTLGIEKVPAGRPCFGHQLHRCSGACVGKESWADHGARLRNVLADWRVSHWPYGGPVMAREGQAWHVLDGWSYFGTVASEQEAERMLAQSPPGFDKDTYKLLVSRLPGMQTQPLTHGASRAKPVDAHADADAEAKADVAGTPVPLNDTATDPC